MQITNKKYEIINFEVSGKVQITPIEGTTPNCMNAGVEFVDENENITVVVWKEFAEFSGFKKSVKPIFTRFFKLKGARNFTIVEEFFTTVNGSTWRSIHPSTLGQVVPANSENAMPDIYLFSGMYFSGQIPSVGMDEFFWATISAVMAQKFNDEKYVEPVVSEEEIEVSDEPVTPPTIEE